MVRISWWKKVSVTIGIPAFNSAKYLSKAINSCYNQTIKPKEIIVVDDGSEDETPSIVKALKSFYNNIRLISNAENKGIGFTRNLIVRECRTKYLAFCSADDELEKNFIQTMLNYAKKYPNAFLYSDYKLIDEIGEFKGAVISPSFKNYDEFTQAVIETAKQDRMFVCYNLFASTKLWKENNFNPEKRFGEDLEHLLKCITKKIPFIHIPFALFRYRIHSTMVTQQKKSEIHENNLDTLRKVGLL